VKEQIEDEDSFMRGDTGVGKELSCQKEADWDKGVWIF
jgi:hypothetical protein